MSRLTYNDRVTGLTPTRGELLEASKAEASKRAETAPSGWDLFKRTWSDQTLYSTLIRWWDRPDEVDPDFRVTRELLDRHKTDDIPLDYLDDIIQSESEPEFMYRLRETRERLETRKRVSEAGWGGTGIAFAAAMLDPAFLPLMPIAGIGLGSKTIHAGATTRAAVRSRAALRGLTTSLAIDVPLETLRYSIDPMGEVEDLFFNVAASATLGTGLGAAFPSTVGLSGWKQQIELEKVRVATERLKTLKEQGVLPKDAEISLDEVLKDADIKRDLFVLADELGVTTIKIEGGKASNKSAKDIYNEIQKKIKTAPAKDSKEALARFDAQFNRVMDMTEHQLMAEAKRLNVKFKTGQRDLTPEDLIENPDSDVAANINLTTLAEPIDDLRLKVLDEMDKRADVIAMSDELTQRVTAARTAAADIDEEGIEALDNMHLISVDYAEELSKPLDKRHWASHWLSKLPWMRPIAIKMSESDNPMIRKFAKIAFEDPGGSTVRDVETIINYNNQAALRKYHQRRAAIRKSEGKEALRFFDNNIAEAIRRGAGPDDLDGPIAEAVEDVRNFFKEMADYAERNGLKDFGKFKEGLKTYVPRMANKAAVNAAINTYGADKVLKLLEQSLKRANSEWDAKKIKATAKGWLKYAQDPEAYENARLIGKDKDKKLAALKEVLRESKLNEDEMKEIVDLLVPKGNDPHLGMTYKRINFDETHSIEIDGNKLNFNDLLVNDMVFLMEKHAARIIGSVEISKMAKALGIKPSGKTSVPTLKDITSTLKIKNNYEEKAVETFYRSAMGLSQMDLMDMGDGWRKAANVIRDLTYVNSMGNVGIAQLPEMLNSMASNGIRATLQSMPALRRMMRQAETGELTDEVLAELEAFVSPGSWLGDGFSRQHRVNDAIGVSLDADGNRIEKAYGKSMTFLRGLTSGSVGVKIGNYSIPLNPLGIAPMDEALRNGHVLSTLQNWVNKAYSVKGGKVIKNSFWSKSRNRFRDLGLTDTEIDEVMEALADPDVVKVRTGILGKKIAGLHLENMDPALRSKLQFALRRDVDRVIQRNKTGNLPQWMQTTTGGLLMQFRQFAVNATQKQLAYSLKHLDGTAVVAFGGTAVMAWVGYCVNTHISSMKYSGKERKEFLEEAFGDQEFMGATIPGGKNYVAAVTRSGWSGTLPMFIDPAARFISPEDENLLNPYVRTTGYGVGPLEGIPAYGLGRDLFMGGKELARWGLHGATGGTAGNEMTEGELRRLLRVVPLRNKWYINRGLNALIEAADRPRTHKR
tara:strand:- start:7442 stop:11242 length:3801 start_codon:yes stop_codon:yes gene_type:complete